jgi:deazaflavin-dependent oxidoreductase (nitroreductase family)
MDTSLPEIPAPNSILAKIMRGEPRTLQLFKKFNKIVSFLYQSYIGAFCGFGYIFVLMETVGRKTGKKRVTPVEYHRLYKNKITVISSRGSKADWVKNIKANKYIVHLQVGFKKYKAKALFIDDKSMKQELLKSYCVTYPYASKMLLGINAKKDEHIFDSEAFKLLADNLEFIAFELMDTKGI